MCDTVWQSGCSSKQKHFGCGHGCGRQTIKRTRASANLSSAISNDARGGESLSVTEEKYMHAGEASPEERGVQHAVHGATDVQWRNRRTTCRPWCTIARIARGMHTDGTARNITRDVTCKTLHSSSNPAATQHAHATTCTRRIGARIYMQRCQPSKANNVLALHVSVNGAF